MSEATAERVRRAARELGYRPNAAAQALRLGASRAVALLVPDMTNPFFSRVLRGAQHAAAAAGYIVILVDTQNDRHWESQSFEALRAGPVDGYLLFEVTAPEALGSDENVVMMETEEPGGRRCASTARAARPPRSSTSLGSATAASAISPPPSGRSPSSIASRAACGCSPRPASIRTRSRGCSRRSRSRTPTRTR